MLARLRRKKELEPIQLSDEQLLRVIKQLKPEHIIPDYVLEALETTEDPKMVFANWIETLSRPALLALEDSDQFKDHKHNDEMWTVIWDAQWTREWPLGKYNKEEVIPDILIHGLKEYNIPKLTKQVEGIQKKMDRILLLLKDKEFCIDGETALKL